MFVVKYKFLYKYIVTQNCYGRQICHMDNRPVFLTARTYKQLGPQSEYKTGPN